MDLYIKGFIDSDQALIKPHKTQTGKEPNTKKSKPGHP